MARVVVVGSANVDLVWNGPRLPRPGETVTDGTFTQALGGKGANQAAAAAALGANVVFIGCVGDDEHGRMCRADLEGRGVDCAHLDIVAAATGVALITVDSSGENAIAVAPGANRSLRADATAGLIRRDDVVLCSCEVPLETVAAAVDTAIAAGAEVVVNPAPARAIFPGAIHTPNQLECEALGGVEALVAAAPAVILTLGREGIELHRAGAPVVRRPGFSVHAVDTTGAGDAFNGALAWALAAGCDLEEAARLASAAGALATRAVGARTALPTVDELYALARS